MEKVGRREEEEDPIIGARVPAAVVAGAMTAWSDLGCSMLNLPCSHRARFHHLGTRGSRSADTRFASGLWISPCGALDAKCRSIGRALRSHSD